MSTWLHGASWIDDSCDPRRQVDGVNFVAWLAVGWVFLVLFLHFFFVLHEPLGLSSSTARNTLSSIFVLVLWVWFGVVTKTNGRYHRCRGTRKTGKPFTCGGDRASDGANGTFAAPEDSWRLQKLLSVKKGSLSQTHKEKHWGNREGLRPQPHDGAGSGESGSRERRLREGWRKPERREEAQQNQERMRGVQ